ncbi:MAG: hypothetical protein ACE15B_07585 [Bryobacteraceae bacterium]
MRQANLVTALAATLLAVPARGGPRFDCWREAPRGFSPDYGDKRAGDFSLVYRAPADGSVPGPFVSSWSLGRGWSLRLWMKAESEAGSWLAVLLDSAGRRAEAAFAASAGWREYDLPLERFRAAPDFDFSAVTGIRFDKALSAGARVWFDDVRFEKSGSEIGVTDKSVDQRMAEEKATRARRVRQAFEAGAKTDFSGRDRQLFDMLWLGRDVEQADRELRAFYEAELARLKNGRADLWSLVANPRLIMAYYTLGSKGNFRPPRLTTATERALLELLWERTAHKNDIALARQSTWWMTGSENHDLNAKVTSLVSSRIFMNEPAFASRVYPDPGHGGGYGYWFHQMYGPDAGAGPEGRGRLADGKQYTARDHYNAWVPFFKQYFAERARKGFFLERASPGYMKYTISYIHLLYEFCGDASLKERTRRFLDLVWADWAQEQLAGLRGGPKTRHHYSTGGYDSMTDLAAFHLGGPGRTTYNYAVQLLGDYAWPRVIWEIALDREGMGEFAAASRGVGEEERTRPRPPGAERTMLGDTPSRFLKYSWVTPDFILGTQMDHPDAVHNHLSVAGRWQGLITPRPSVRIVFTAGPLDDPKRQGADMELLMAGVQHGRVLITQQARRWSQIHPDWYPAQPNRYEKPVEIYTGRDWAEVEEQGGWVFLSDGNAYAAIRVLREGEGRTCRWNEDRTALRLEDKFSPVILEAGRRASFATLAAFEKAVLANPLEIRRTVVPGFFMVSYRGCGPDAPELVFNAANNDVPMIGGRYIEYAPAKVFDSPFLESQYGSGVVEVRKGGQKLILDFRGE